MENTFDHENDSQKHAFRTVPYTLELFVCCAACYLRAAQFTEQPLRVVPQGLEFLVRD